MKLKKIDSVLNIETGAPLPTIMSNDYRLILLYYYDKDLEYQGPFEKPIERSFSETGVASIEFKNYCIYKFGYPNDEAISSHTYYAIGLRPYEIFEVIGSSWLEEIKTMKKNHIHHSRTNYSGYRHFIIGFHDSCFECIAENFEIIFKSNLSMDEALKKSVQYFVS